MVEEAAPARGLAAKRSPGSRRAFGPSPRTEARWGPLAAALLLASGCGGPKDPGPCGIFAARCTGLGCHGEDNPAAGLDLESGDLESRLVGRPAGTCAGTLVDPATPEASILYRKLTPMPPCGARMPLDRTPLNDAEMQCVLEWIATR
jgi:hypothetical protein